MTPHGDRIQIRFTWRGQDLRPTLDWRPTAANMNAARKLRRQILDEIRDGVFVLTRHFPDYRFAEKVDPGSGDAVRTFDQWADAWLAVSARSMEHSTLAIYRRHLAAYWRPVWGALPPRRITHEMVLRRLSELSEPGETRAGLGRKTQNNVLIPLRGVLQLACRALGLADPTEGIENLKTQKPQPDPFTADEVEVVLAKLAEVAGAEIADWFGFMIFAGLRESEQVALSWADVDLRSGTLVVRGAQVLGKAKDRTKTHRQRTVELNDRALAILGRQRARTALQAHGKVFAAAGNPAKPWRDGQVQNRAWMRVLRLTGIRYRAPKECRDTSVTMNLLAGAASP